MSDYLDKIAAAGARRRRALARADEELENIARILIAEPKPNVAEAARRAGLGDSRATLYRRMARIAATPSSSPADTDR
jgi:hypothetical protein